MKFDGCSITTKRVENAYDIILSLFHLSPFHPDIKNISQYVLYYLIAMIFRYELPAAKQKAPCLAIFC